MVVEGENIFFERVIREGDSLYRLAERYGLASWRDIYFAEENSLFRRMRPDPNRIFPGDIVYVPFPLDIEEPVAVENYDEMYEDDGREDEEENDTRNEDPSADEETGTAEEEESTELSLTVSSNFLNTIELGSNGNFWFSA